jgi:polysaccharide chain length determinant protein (PEP-CTERM system associated)
MHSEPDVSRLTHRLRESWSRRKWLAAGVFAVVAAAGVTLVSSLPDIYRATATVLVEEPRVEASVAAELDRRLQLINQEILSRARLDAIIQRLGLYPGLRQQSPQAAVERMRRDVQTEFKASSVAGGIGGTITLAVSYRGRDPQTVTRVANALAGLYLEEDERIRERQASGNVQALAKQLETLKQTMEAQERELATFQDRHLGELPEQSEANLAALEQLHAELRSTSEERMRALDRRNDLLRRLADVDGEARATPSTPRAGPGRLERLREELADLQRRFSDRYPDVIRVKAEIAALESQPAAEAPAAAGAVAAGSSRAAARLKDELTEVDRQVALLRSDEARLRSGIGGYIQRLQNAPRRQQALQDISRDHQTTREVYDTLRKRYEQAQLEEETASGAAGRRFRILDGAVQPTSPAAPNRRFLLLVALAGALALAAAAAAVAEHLDTSFHGDDVLSVL